MGTKLQLNPSPISNFISNSLLCSHISFSRTLSSFPVLVHVEAFRVIEWTVNIPLENNRELQQRRRRRQRQQERQKSSRFRLAKQQLCTCITLFCTILCRHCTTTTWKCLISRFLEDVNTRQRISFSFSELWYSLLIIIVNNNKYDTYIAHIQKKYFHMRITDDKIKISQLKAIFK